MLLETGRIQDVNAAAENFESPFATAVRMRKFDIAQCLLDHGADINYLAINGCTSFPVDGTPMTVLGRVLLSAGSSLSSLACVDFLLQTQKASLFTNSEKNETVLHCLGVDSELGNGGNPIFVAEAFKLLNSHFQFTKEQLDAQRNQDGGTALELAVLNTNAALVEVLLQAGAEWDVIEPNPRQLDSALVTAMKHVYLFPRRTKVEGNCPPKEDQLDRAFRRRRHITLLLCRKARERSSSAPVFN